MKIFIFFLFGMSEVDQTTDEIEMRKTRLRLKNYVHFYEHFSGVSGVLVSVSVSVYFDFVFVVSTLKLFIYELMKHFRSLRAGQVADRISAISKCWDLRSQVVFVVEPAPPQFFFFGFLRFSALRRAKDSALRIVNWSRNARLIMKMYRDWPKLAVRLIIRAARFFSSKPNDRRIWRLENQIDLCSWLGQQFVPWRSRT